MSESDLERRLASALRAPIVLRPGAVDLVMHRVREAAAHGAGPRRRTLPLAARSARHSLVGLAMAASISSVAVLSLAPAADRAPDEHTRVIGDSVMATLRDTLRLVRLIFDDPGARRVSAVGDFNGWQSSATPLRREGSTRRWSAVVAMRDGDHRYAFVVDGARWVPDPSTTPVRDSGRLVSLLHVARASN